MRLSSERHVVVRAVSLVLIISQLTACSSWRTQEATPERVLGPEIPGAGARNGR